MGKIKTKEKAKDIKVLDKSNAVGMRMKSAFLRSKSSLNRATDKSSSSAQEGANDRLEAMEDEIRVDAVAAGKNAGRGAIKGGKKIASKIKDRKVITDAEDVPNGHSSVGICPQTSGKPTGSKSIPKAERPLPEPPTLQEQMETQGRRLTVKRAENRQKATVPQNKTLADTNGECPSKSRPKPKTRGKASMPKTQRRPAKTPGVKASTGKLAEKSSQKAVQVAGQETARIVAAATKKTASQAAKATAKATSEVVKAVAKFVASILGMLGGSTVLVALLIVVLIAAIANSPFGIFFAGGSHDPGTVSVSQAVTSIQDSYDSRLSSLQSGSYDGIVLSGEHADWVDVVAVFSARYAASDVDGVAVSTLDANRQALLEAVFWDMTEISSYVETIDHPDSDPDDEVDDSWTEYILHIEVTAITADDMRTIYGFSPEQSTALEELLTDRAALSSLVQNLAITDTQSIAILNALPEELSDSRKLAVKTALSLVGKVNYFWGGKSYVTGWDPRWGQTTLVSSDGSSTTGTYRPFGLDCTGFIDWTLRNAGLPSDGHWLIGTNLTAVSDAEALPGDLALFPDNSHIGMVVGRNSAGQLLICHCNARDNGVSVTEFVSTGFTALGQPNMY